MSASPQKPVPPVELGAVVAEKYRIETLLGEGGMGFVFAALHLQLGHRVALKVLHSSAVSDHDVTERFLREGRALARLQGEHIARVSDVGTLPTGEPYLVMEFLEGQDLARELTERGPLPLAETVEFIAQACEALAEAHVRGIVHRDLKPANLFLSHKLDGEVSVKVLDFGISKVSSGDGMAMEAENITMTSTLVGTPKYMSPEQIQDSRSVDARTDIWGLGTIFYELLTQNRPFAAPTLALVCVKVLHEEVPPPSSMRSDIPPGVDAIIAKCLMKHPADRYANVGELVEALVPFGPPSVHASAARVQRIVTSALRSSGPRLGPDSSGGTPGVISVSTPSGRTPGVDSGQPMSRTPSAIRVDMEVATLTTAESPAGPGSPRRLKLVAAIGAAALLGSAILFFALHSIRSPQATIASATGAQVQPVPTPDTSPTTPVGVAAKPAATTPSATASAAPSATASAAASATASAAAIAKWHWVRPPAGGHHVTGSTTAKPTSAPTPSAAPTQSAAPVSPKGTGDVLEDRR